MGRDHRQSAGHFRRLDGGGAGAALAWESKPERFARVGDDHVERTVAHGIDKGQHFHRRRRARMIQGLEWQFTTARVARSRSQRVQSIEDTGGDAGGVEAKPSAAGLLVEPGHNPWSFRPMPRRWPPVAVVPLIAIRRQKNGPLVARAAQDHQCAHEKFLINPKVLAAPGHCGAVAAAVN